jgi:hypothetical protein
LRLATRHFSNLGAKDKEVEKTCFKDNFFPERGIQGNTSQKKKNQ